MITAINKKHQSKVNRACAWLIKYNSFNNQSGSNNNTGYQAPPSNFGTNPFAKPMGNNSGVQSSNPFMIKSNQNASGSSPPAFTIGGGGTNVGGNNGGNGFALGNNNKKQ